MRKHQEFHGVYEAKRSFPVIYMWEVLELMSTLYPYSEPLEQQMFKSPTTVTIILVQMQGLVTSLPLLLLLY